MCKILKNPPKALQKTSQFFIPGSSWRLLLYLRRFSSHQQWGEKSWWILNSYNISVRELSAVEREKVEFHVMLNISATFLIYIIGKPYIHTPQKIWNDRVIALEKGWLEDYKIALANYNPAIYERVPVRIAEWWYLNRICVYMYV